MNSNCENASRIFEGYRALGLVTNEVPFVVRYVAKLDDLRIVTCVGRYFYSFNSKLRLLESSHAHKGLINVIATDSIHVFTACENEIYAWRYGHKKLAHTFYGHEHKVHSLLPFGPHLISVDEESILKVWEINTKKIILEIPFSNHTFKITKVFHPSTFLNKVLLGSEQGSLQLWNIRTQKLIYTFEGWKSAVTCIEQSPAINVVAIGLSNGKIVVHDLKLDETVMSFTQEWGAVLSLTFRTDDPDNHPFLVSSSPVGHIAVWNLEKKKLQTQMRNLHKGAITGCRFIEKEPLLITTSMDNSLKVWCFDQSDDSGRLLHLRDGHSAPPCRVRFHGCKGNWVLSAGLDSNLRSFSTYSERLNRSLGEASFNRKMWKKFADKREELRMPPIIEFTTEMTREKEWDNIAACHRRLGVVTTWSFDKMKMGEHKLKHQRFNGNSNVCALCLCLSACGNFVLIGYNTGHIDKYNIQSGIFRGTFGPETETAHEGPVQGIVSDNLNQLALSGGNDGEIKFWRFKKGQFLSSLKFKSSISQMIIHRENSLVAVSFDNFSISVIDVETRRVIREFTAHQDRISDMTFSADARWLIVASMDCSIRTWDLPLGKLVDHFLVATPCVSLTMSPTGEFLATAHTEDLGVYLWANLSIFIPLHLTSLPDNFKPSLLDLPFVKSDESTADEPEGEDEAVNVESEEVVEETNEESMDVDLENTSEPSDLVTLSSLHSSRWKNLLYIDLIKKRNKPKEAFQKPEAAPFFIPVVPGLQPKFDVPEETRTTDSVATKSVSFASLSAFSHLLMECSDKSNYTPVIEALKEMGPSAIDVEIRSMDTFVDKEREQTFLLLCFMEALQQGLRRRRDFEFIHACFALFLKIHSNVIMTDKRLTDECKILCETVEKDWERLRLLFSESLCIINYLRSVVL